MPKIRSRQQLLLYSLPVLKKQGFFHFARFTVCCSEATKPAVCIPQYKLARAIFLSFVIKALSGNTEHVFHFTTSETGLTARPNLVHLLQLVTKKLANSFSGNTDISRGHRILLMSHPIEGLMPDKQETEILALIPPPPPIPIDISKHPETFSIHRLAENTSLVTVDHIVADC